MSFWHFYIISYLCSVFVYCLKKEYISETCYSKNAELILILLQLFDEIHRSVSIHQQAMIFIIVFFLRYWV